MYRSLIIFIFVLFISLKGLSQSKLLWMDAPKRVENPTNVFDKRARRRNNKVVIPKYNLKICYKEETPIFYYKRRVFFDSSKYLKEQKNFFSELYGEFFFIAIFKPTKDSTFHNPISVRREKMLIIDFKNSPEYVYEVDLGGYLLLPSKELLKKLIDYNNNEGIVGNGKTGIIQKFDLSNKVLIILDSNEELIEFKLTKRDNKL